MIYLILLTHWVSDFILQTDAMAKGKSTSNAWLSRHVLAYMLPFLVLFGPAYAATNAVAHWGIDWVTSRISSQLWKEQKVHAFFVVIGWDQLLHTIILIATMPLIRAWWLP